MKFWPAFWSSEQVKEFGKFDCRFSDGRSYLNEFCRLIGEACRDDQGQPIYSVRVVQMSAADWVKGLNRERYSEQQFSQS